MTDQPMTDIRERHVRYEGLSRVPWMEEPDPDVCASCHQPWGTDGCDAIVATERADKAEAALADTANALEMTSTAFQEILNESLQHAAERDAALVREKALAEAFDRLAADWHRRLHDDMDWRGCAADACVANQSFLAREAISKAVSE